jgi:lysozyme
MKINQEGVNLIKRFEGFRGKAYLCPSGKPTIGFGTTKNVFLGMTCTEEEAESWLRRDLEYFESKVNEYVKVPLTSNQFSALVSFVYNVGAYAFKNSTLLRKLNQGEYHEVPNQLMRWVYGTVNGRKTILNGLLYRREAESQLWNS